MTKFVFEDNDSTPSSLLLKSSYNGSNIEFASSSSRVYKHLMELSTVSGITSCIVFFDVVPDNRATVKWYQTLLEDLKEANPYFEVYVLPIPCIEFYILKFLYNYSYLSCKPEHKNLIENLVVNFNWKNAKVYLKSLSYGDSLEKLYKSLLANQNMPCLRNRNAARNALIGKFYREDCDCNREFCKTDCRDCVSLKAERLYTSLPIFDVISEQHSEYLKKLGIEVCRVEIEDVMRRCYEFYSSICSQLGKPNINMT